MKLKELMEAKKALRLLFNFGVKLIIKGVNHGKHNMLTR